MPPCRHDRAAMTEGLVNPAVRQGRICNAALQREPAAIASVGALFAQVSVALAVKTGYNGRNRLGRKIFQ